MELTNRFPCSRTGVIKFKSRSHCKPARFLGRLDPRVTSSKNEISRSRPRMRLVPRALHCTILEVAWYVHVIFYQRGQQRFHVVDRFNKTGNVRIT